ncbi:MAG: AMP-binding protein [Pseudomonadota bacterium]
MSPQIADPDTAMTRDELEARGAKGAAALAALGVGPDDKVAVIMRNDLAHLEVMRGVSLAEAILVPLNWHAAAQEVADILADSGAEVVILHRDLIAPVESALAGKTVIAVTPDAALTAAYSSADQAPASGTYPEWSDLLDAAAPVVGRPPMRAMMRYTSGSTGKPKGIRRIPAATDSGPADYYAIMRRIAPEMFRFRPGGRFLTAAPLYHSAPGTLTAMALAMEDMAVHVLPRFDPVSFLEAIEREKITHIYLVPTMMSRLLKLPEDVKARYDTSSVEFCVSTGSPWPHEVKRAMIDWWGPVFWETYGASEIGFMTMVTSEEALARPGTAGRIQLGGSIRVYDADGQQLPPGEVGDIYVKMDAFGKFDYSNDPEGRKRAEIDEHVSVGDMGWLDEDGFLFITDRKKDMIISGGANIFPAEIEAVLIEAPFVTDVAVFGAPDEEFGEKIVAAIQPAAGWTPDADEVMRWLGGRLARFKQPRIIDFHNALPREDSGKIFKPRLRAPYWEGAGRSI